MVLVTTSFSVPILLLAVVSTEPSPNPDFEIVNRNQLKTKRRIVTIGNMAVPIGVSDGVHYTREDFTIKVASGKISDKGSIADLDIGWGNIV
jgi:hypothetical protein